MWKSLRNRPFRVFLSSVMLPASVAATPLHHCNLTASQTVYTAGTPEDTDSSLIVSCFRNNTGGAPDAAEDVRIVLVDNGEVVPGAMSNLTFTTQPGIINYLGALNNTVFTLFLAGNPLQFRAIGDGGSELGDSVPLQVDPNVSARLVALAPGMRLNPGKDSSISANTGQAGLPKVQEPGQRFQITVIETDDWFNRATPTTPNISFLSDENLVNLPPSNTPLNGGEESYGVNVAAARKTVNITVTSGGMTSSVIGIPMGGPEKETIFPHPSPFNPRAGGPMRFRFRLNQPGGVAVIVKDRFGQDVWRTEFSGGEGQNEASWDGRNQNGHIVAAGVYYGLLEVGGEIKSKKQFGVVK